MIPLPRINLSALVQAIEAEMRSALSAGGSGIGVSVRVGQRTPEPAAPWEPPLTGTTVTAGGFDLRDWEVEVTGGEWQGQRGEIPLEPQISVASAFLGLPVAAIAGVEGELARALGAGGVRTVEQLAMLGDADATAWGAMVARARARLLFVRLPLLPECAGAQATLESLAGQTPDGIRRLLGESAVSPPLALLLSRLLTTLLAVLRPGLMQQLRYANLRAAQGEPPAKPLK
jgi:hypothetical protein